MWDGLVVCRVFFRPRAHFTCGNIFSFHNWGSLTPWYFNLSDSSGALLPLTVKWNVALQLLHFHRGHKASIFRNSFNRYQVQFHTNWHWPCQLRWSQSDVLTNNSTVHTSVLLKCQSVWEVTALIHFNLQVTLAVGYTAILWQKKDILLKNKTKTCWHFNSFRNITSTNQHSCLHKRNLFVTTGRWGKLVPLHKQPHTLSSWIWAWETVGTPGSITPEMTKKKKRWSCDCRVDAWFIQVPQLLCIFNVWAVCGGGRSRNKHLNHFRSRNVTKRSQALTGLRSACSLPHSSFYDLTCFSCLLTTLTWILFWIKVQSERCLWCFVKTVSLLKHIRAMIILRRYKWI